jgi:hypothetical protein
MKNRENLREMEDAVIDAIELMENTNKLVDVLHHHIDVLSNFVSKIGEALDEYEKGMEKEKEGK